jgi:hypothetical protein
VSERERLLGRQLPATPFRLQVDHTPAANTAAGELDAARRAVQLAKDHGDDMLSATTRLDAAVDAYEPYCLVLYVRVIPADLYEQIELEHPPSPDQAARGYQWDPATFAPALLEACVDGDMTADDWAEMRRVGGRVATGEINALINLCLAVNDRTPDPYLGKG